MSGSFPLSLPPGSERLILWPIPPRLRSRPQSPERSAALEDWMPVGFGTADLATVFARKNAPRLMMVTNVIDVMIRRFRISKLLPLCVRFASTPQAYFDPIYAYS